MHNKYSSFPDVKEPFQVLNITNTSVEFCWNRSLSCVDVTIDCNGTVLKYSKSGLFICLF